MEFDVHVVELTKDKRNELSEYFTSLVIESEIYKQKSKEAAIRFALEKRVPDKNEYFQLMTSIFDEVRENDEIVNQKMEEKMVSMMIGGKDSEITETVLKLMKLLKKDGKTDKEEQLH